MQMVHLMAEEAIKAINAMKDNSAEPTDIQSVSLNQVSITIDQVVASSQACKMIAYFFRGLLARALKAHCIRVGTSFRASARVELGILSPTDQCALLQFVSCIERYHKGQQLTVESLLLMPLVRADVSWRRWRYLLGAKGRIVLERAMAEFESQHV
jgi:Na+/H+-translocating membrane pyrophosphatase